MSDIPRGGGSSNRVPPVTPTTFEGFAALGYTRLVPIIPPGAPVSASSSLLKRIDKNDPRGKTPGLRNSDGLWHGFDWGRCEAQPSDLPGWQAMGAGIGIKTGLAADGRTLAMIDADTTDLGTATTVRKIIERRLGITPARVGQDPKAGYLIACSEPFKYARVEFAGANDTTERVEILTDGRQFVAHGVHPKTKKFYSWPRPLVPYAELPTFTAEEILAFMRELEETLPAAKPIIREGGGAEVDQESLKGKLEHVRAAVAAIPNTSEHFPSRESYRDFGYAIKGALQDHPQEALELFEEWSDRWTDDVNPPGFAEAEWSRMQPPFRVGASMLYEIADRIGNGTFRQADAWFDEIPDEPDDNPFAERAKADREQNEKEAAPKIEWKRASDWKGYRPPVREWEVPSFIPRGEVTLFYGDGGIGKTLAIQQYASAAAAGVSWLGQPTRKARVMCFFCEDSEEEIQRRQIAINKALGITHDDLDNLWIATRRFMDNLLVLWDRNTGEMKRKALWDQLRRDALEFKADVVILDTLADIYSGSEIDRVQVNAFVKSALGKLMHEIGGTVIVLGHPSVAGMQSGSGTSGSTAWGNSVRSRLYMRHPTPPAANGQSGARRGAAAIATGNFREIQGMKTNYAGVGQLIKVEWHAGAFRAIGATVTAMPEDIEGMAMPKEGLASLDDQCDAAVMSAVAHYHGHSLTTSKQTARYAPRIFKTENPGRLFDGIEIPAIEQSILRLTLRGAIKHTVVGRTPQRKDVMGYALMPDRAPSDDVSILD